MIENESEMSFEIPNTRRTPTWDGSLFGPDVCRCNAHIDPHRHVDGGDVESVFTDTAYIWADE